MTTEEEQKPKPPPEKTLPPPWDAKLRERLAAPPFDAMVHGGTTDDDGLDNDDDKIADMLNAETVLVPFVGEFAYWHSIGATSPFNRYDLHRARLG